MAETERSQHPVGKAWHELAEVMTEQADLLERLERAIQIVRSDVGVVFNQVGDVKAPVKRMERANEFRFDRIDARLEQLTGLGAADSPHETVPRQDHPEGSHDQGKLV